MGKNSIVISCVFTQSDIRNDNVHARFRRCWRTMSGSFKSVWHFIVKIYARFKERNEGKYLKTSRLLGMSSGKFVVNNTGRSLYPLNGIALPLSMLGSMLSASLNPKFFKQTWDLCC
jgi:hypothetical protein